MLLELECRFAAALRPEQRDHFTEGDDPSRFAAARPVHQLADGLVEQRRVDRPLPQLRGWTPLIALQVEYSLIERTVEGELMPAAIELGLGVTPWSPLRGGVLSGKYTRANARTMKADRGERVTQFLDERTFAIIDELLQIANTHSTTAAAVALAWVQRRPGVASTIIGARRLDQLEQNLAALDVVLSAEEAATLDRLSQPTLNFPANFLKAAGMFMHAGATVNGEKSIVWPLSPKSDAERY